MKTASNRDAKSPRTPRVGTAGATNEMRDSNCAAMKQCMSEVIEAIVAPQSHAPMKNISTGQKRGKFELLARSRDVQVAKMSLAPGGTSDDQPSNEHPRSEQWLLVVSGTGEARVGKRKSNLRTIKLRKNSLLLIEKGELHQIKNSGRSPLQTINFYAAPAYDEHAEPL
jgi:mannose-6-phosphate isomerase-like protein (cupin superfamily)